jgi:hypothetical protein
VGTVHSDSHSRCGGDLKSTAGAEGGVTMKQTSSTMPYLSSLLFIYMLRIHTSHFAEKKNEI